MKLLFYKTDIYWEICNKVNKGYLYFNGWPNNNNYMMNII